MKLEFNKLIIFITKERSKRIELFLIIINILISIFIIIFAFIFVHSKNILHYAASGYTAIFIATLIGSSTIFLPAPNIAVIMLGGILFSPILSGIIGGLGWALGEIVGYYVGRYFFSKVAKSKKTMAYYNKAEKYINKWGLKAIFLFSLIPNPAFDIIGIVSGVYKIPVFKFLGACIAGKIIVAIAISLFAHYGYLSL